ncbi:MAG: hypothetical protein E3J94_04955 [Desulfobacteraceae bacterium]|nr:MAG: hypothetical protein E3J94_04955 [Desulfobacteraceae bacterium]
MEQNEILLMQTLYATIGKQKIQLDALRAVYDQSVKQVGALNEEIKELKEDGNKSNKKSG